MTEDELHEDDGDDDDEDTEEGETVADDFHAASVTTGPPLVGLLLGVTGVSLEDDSKLKVSEERSLNLDDLTTGSTKMEELRFSFDDNLPPQDWAPEYGNEAAAEDGFGEQSVSAA